MPEVQNLAAVVQRQFGNGPETVWKWFGNGSEMVASGSSEMVRESGLWEASNVKIAV